MASASARVFVIGFSTRTCLPAPAAASARGRWVGTGVAITTASMSDRAKSSSSPSASTPNISATSPARRPPLIATSVASGTWRAMTRAQVSPMNPEPRTPNRTGSATGQPLPLGAATTGVTSVPRSPMVPVITSPALR